MKHGIPEGIEISVDKLEYLIDNYVVGKHAERNRMILKRRLIDGILFEPLSEEFKMSDRQVKKIVYKHEKAIFRHLPTSP